MVVESRAAWEAGLRREDKTVLGGACLSDKYCTEGICKNAVCVRPVLNERCDPRGKCSAGYSCNLQSRRCVFPNQVSRPLTRLFNCTAASDCKSDQYCQYPEKQCVTLVGHQGKCSASRHCREGLSCYNGTCVQRCRWSEDCSPGVSCEQIPGDPYKGCIFSRQHRMPWMLPPSPKPDRMGHKDGRILGWTRRQFFVSIGFIGLAVVLIVAALVWMWVKKRRSASAMHCQIEPTPSSPYYPSSASSASPIDFHPPAYAPPAYHDSVFVSGPHSELDSPRPLSYPTNDPKA